MKPQRVTPDHIYFSDLEWLETHLSQRVTSRPLPDRDALGSFDGTLTGMQGYVWSTPWIVGVWAEMTDHKSTNIVFWTVRDGRLYLWEDDVTWSRSEIVQRAGAWLDSLQLQPK